MKQTADSIEDCFAAGVSRRDALATAALGGLVLFSRAAAGAEPGASASSAAPTEFAARPRGALAGGHTVAPLPFAPGSLNGLSERMLTSHHEHNYGAAVRNLNRVEKELSQMTPETPPFDVVALRERELTFRNSKALHEAYFGNLGGGGKRFGPIEGALAQAYGTVTKWEQHVRSTALGLGGGSGWVVLALELDTASLRTFASSHHTQVLATSLPLLVLDMYEHAYQLDFGAGVAKYIEAFFANVNWGEVNARLDRAQKACAIWRGAPG